MRQNILFKILVLGLLVLIGRFWSTQALADKIYLPRAILIKGTGPEVYVLENNLKRWIPSPEVFESFKYKWESINVISNTSLGYYADGSELNEYDNYPEGSLVKGSGPAVYLIELGKRRWIPNPSIFGKYGFNWRDILQITDETLASIDLADNVKSSEPDKYPETFILTGPAQNAVLKTAEVSFKYSATNPLGPNSDLSFYTYLKGYDNDWHQQSSDTVDYSLLAGNKAYTFYVRAENREGYIDLSPAWRDFSVNISSYYAKVKINQIESNQESYKNDYLILRNDGDEAVDVTGWTVTNKRNESITIPKAAPKLTFPYSASYRSDIILDADDELVIAPNDRSPVSMDFKTNKCTGYLNDSYIFNPALDKDCPEVAESQYAYLKKDCRDFITGLSSCELPNYADNFAVSADGQCTDFLNNNFNYQQCYASHNKEIGFFTDEWRIFANQSVDFLDNYEDKIILKDKNGLIIDTYDYTID